MYGGPPWRDYKRLTGSFQAFSVLALLFRLQCLLAIQQTKNAKGGSAVISITQGGSAKGMQSTGLYLNLGVMDAASTLQLNLTARWSPQQSNQELVKIPQGCSAKVTGTNKVTLMSLINNTITLVTNRPISLQNLARADQSNAYSSSPL